MASLKNLDLTGLDLVYQGQPYVRIAAPNSALSLMGLDYVYQGQPFAGEQDPVVHATTYGAFILMMLATQQ